MSGLPFDILPGFLNCEGRQLFAIRFTPSKKPAKGSILYFQPFAEEMHRSRRTVATQARAFAASGYNVMLLDLSGCGDSHGHFSDASWGLWRQDVECALEALSAETRGPVMLWGVRLGALLACDIATGRQNIERVLMWQPVLNGEQHVDQFLRFELAGQVMRGESGFNRPELWKQLRSGRSLEVAGYVLSPTLALEVAKVRLGDLLPACPVTWLDIGSSQVDSPSVASSKVISRWRQEGADVSWHSIQGEPFWRNAECGCSLDLIAATSGMIV